MILADKIIELRKKNGWSQEELAEMLSVSRQSVSKWEGAQSTPSLDKIVKMSQVFGVSIDYLLNEDIEEVEYIETDEDFSPLRRVSMEEANDFLDIKEDTSTRSGLAIFTFIISPALMFILLGASVQGYLPIGEDMAIGLGLLGLFILVALGVGILIVNSNRIEEYNFMEDELIDTEYGVAGMVKDRKEKYKPSYVKGMILGVGLCILAAIPLITFSLAAEENLFYIMLGLSLTLLLAALGVFFIVSSSIQWDSYDQVLQERDYSPKNKKLDKKTDPVMTIYWVIVTAIYLLYSFISNDWGRSWIIWPVAAILSVLVKMIAESLVK